MNRVVVSFMFLLLVCGCAQNALPPAGNTAAGKDPASTAVMFKKAISSVYPALVRVEVVVPIFHEGREIRVQGGGSGAIVSADGLVVTNHHVAGQATSIICVLPDKSEIRAERVGTDPMTDICVLQLTEKKVYPYASFGDSAKLRVGDTVLAMGSPGSLSQSVTAGVISNVDLILPPMMAGQLRLQGEDVGAMVKWIAHDAAIFPGNSGGPLVSLNGEIVGINELGLGLSAAIPSNLAKSVVDEIVKLGAPRRSWLGIVSQPLLKSSGRKEGVLISGIVPASPAEEAGLKPGDILLSYDGQPVTARFQEDLPVINRLVFATPVDKKTQLIIERDGTKKTLEVTTRLRTVAEPDDSELKEWGMAARNIGEMAARAMKRKTPDGVLVVSIRPGGPCSEAKPAVQSGDVIVAINGKPVKNVDELIARTAEIVKEKKEPVPTLVAFERKNEQWLTLVKVGIRDLPDRSPDASKAWLPASFQVLTADLAEALGLQHRTGVRLTDVFEGSSAAQAGLKVGDIIAAIDGDPVLASKPEDADVLPAMIRQRNVGQTVKLALIRDGKDIELPVKLDRSPKATREMKHHREIELGFTARDLSDEDRRTMKIEEQITGPIIAEVESGSLAAVADLRVSDVVIALNGKPTPDVAALKKLMADVHTGKPPRIVFFVKRGIITVFVEAETPWAASKN